MTKKEQTKIELVRRIHGLVGNDDVEKTRQSQEYIGAILGNTKEVKYTEDTMENVPTEWISVNRPHIKKNVILYCHGGGYSTGSSKYSRTITSKLAIATSMEVITFEDGDPAAGFDPFDNTVRTDLSDCWQLTELQPGLGLETGWFIDGSTGRSRWLLTDMLKAPLEGYKPVFKTDGMAVYRRIEE